MWAASRASAAIFEKFINVHIFKNAPIRSGPPDSHTYTHTHARALLALLTPTSSQQFKSANLLALLRVLICG
jgi:hypothetical protein